MDPNIFRDPGTLREDRQVRAAFKVSVAQGVWPSEVGLDPVPGCVCSIM